MWEVPDPDQQYVQRPLPVTSLRDSANGDARLIKLVHVEVLDKSEATGSGRKRNRLFQVTPLQIIMIGLLNG